jgi:hypothetical protein
MSKAHARDEAPVLRGASCWSLDVGEMKTELLLCFALVVTLLLSAEPAHAECIAAGRWWIDEKSVDLVFSGTVVNIVRTAETGYQATFDVDRVWKGSVPTRFELYVWEGAAEPPRLEARSRYIVGAKRLAENREREGAGVMTSEVAFGPIQCGALLYTDAERLGMTGALDAGRPPSR